jgi:excisionase family DNA binding protein
MIDNPFASIERRFNRIECLLIDIQKHHFQSTQVPSLSLKQETEIEFDTTGVANYLKCSKQTIHNLKKEGVLPFYRLGRKVYFKKSEIDGVARVGNLVDKKKGVAK